MLKTFVATLAIAFLLGGCAATFNGGMPDLPFNVEEDLGVVKAEMKQYASVKTYYDNPTIAARNKFIASRLVVTNIEYLKYIKSLSAEESQLHSASDILVLTLDLAAAAFVPVNTKTVLSSLAALVTGSRISIDKNAYLEKTMSALIASMNAQRKVVLQRIILGTGADLNGYSFEQALSDINDYYLAGTLRGAINSIQGDAGIKEAKADGAISEIMFKRSKGFVDVEAQVRVDKLLDEVGKLTDAALLDLAKAPPVTDPTVELAVGARDPGQLRLTSADVAGRVTKFRIVLSPRSESGLALWEAALKSLPKKP